MIGDVKKTPQYSTNKLGKNSVLMEIYRLNHKQVRTKSGCSVAVESGEQEVDTVIGEDNSQKPQD